MSRTSCGLPPAVILVVIVLIIVASCQPQDAFALTMAPAISLTWNEALSGIVGSVSLAAWIFLLVPQLIENYQQGHADGISMTFLIIWFAGDVANLAGAVWAKLVPTVTALAVYFCFADVILLLQCFYYLTQKKRAAEKADNLEAQPHGVPPNSTEQTPLLRDQSQSKRRLTDVTDENMGLPGSRRRSSALGRSSTVERRDSLHKALEEPTRTRTIIKNTVSILGICAIGAAGWAAAWRTGAWRPTPVGQEGNGESTPIGAEILGYLSAVLYLGARIPQIVKNQRERSCEGLSLLFFMLSLLGNLSYGAGVSRCGG